MDNPQKETILVVDDEVEQLRILLLGLRSRQYGVATARNAQEALDQLSNNTAGISLVLTDYAMPGMDGLALLKKIRAEFQKLTVIMMTAHDSRKLLAEAMQYQCSGFLEKPFTLQELIEEIERVNNLGGH